MRSDSDSLDLSHPIIISKIFYKQTGTTDSLMLMTHDVEVWDQCVSRLTTLMSKYGCRSLKVILETWKEYYYIQGFLGWNMSFIRKICRLFCEVGHMHTVYKSIECPGIERLTNAFPDQENLIYCTSATPSNRETIDQ